MNEIIITTASGREYTFHRTLTQDMVCKWVDPTGDKGIKGSYQKVWEHCQLAVQPTVGGYLHIQGTCRYTMRPVSRRSTRITRITRITVNGTEVQYL